MLKVVNSLDNLVWQLGVDNAIFKFIAKLIVFCLKIILTILIPIIFLAASRNLAMMQYLQSHFSWGRKTIFQGLFFEANFPKKLDRNTVLYLTTKNFSSKFGDGIEKARHLVKLEDPEFERLFRVNSNDQVKARYILSTSLMKRIKGFYKKVKRPMQISFIGDKVYIAIAYDHHVFEPRLFENMVSFAPLKEYFEVLSFMLAIVQDLNLNLKIWGQS